MGKGGATSQTKELFEDYDGFVEKFKPKKTTDDCYTPPQVYRAVLDWAAAEYGLAGREIVRPFFPGGDYDLVHASRHLEGRQGPHQHRHAVQRLEQLIHAAHPGRAARRRHQRGAAGPAGLPHFFEKRQHLKHPLRPIGPYCGTGGFCITARSSRASAS